jgi:hypothetical protein
VPQECKVYMLKRAVLVLAAVLEMVNSSAAVHNFSMKPISRALHYALFSSRLSPCPPAYRLPLNVV